MDIPYEPKQREDDFFSPIPRAELYDDPRIEDIKTGEKRKSMILDQDYLITSLDDTRIILERSGTPSDGIQYLLKRQVAGWVNAGVTNAQTALDAWTGFLANNPQLLDLFHEA